MKTQGLGGGAGGGWQFFSFLDFYCPFKGHEFEQTQGDSEGQGSLMCCSSWGCQESDMTWQLNKNNKISFQ